MRSSEAIYLPVYTAGFQSIQAVVEGDIQVLIWLGGQPLGSAWTPPVIKLLQEDPDGSSLTKGDLLYCNGCTILASSRAREALASVLAQGGEFLPVLTDRGEVLWAFNTFCLLDAFDEDASVYERLRTGLIWQISEYVFRPEVVRGVSSFKSPAVRGKLFVSEAVAMAVHEAGLRGQAFRHLWSG